MVVEVMPIEAPPASTVGVQVSPVADRTRTEMSAGTEIDIVMSGQLYVPEQSSLQLEISRATRKKTAMVLIRDSMRSIARQQACQGVSRAAAAQPPEPESVWVGMPINERSAWRRIAWLAVAIWALSLVLPAVWFRPDGRLSLNIVYSGWQALWLCLIVDGEHEHIGPTALLRAMALSNLIVVAAPIVLALPWRRWVALALGLTSLAALILDISALEWMRGIPFTIGYWAWIASFATLAAACLAHGR